jgi:hypothetical protein
MINPTLKAPTTHADVQLFPIAKPKPAPQPVEGQGQKQGLQFQPRRSPSMHQFLRGVGK